ncbi:MAG: sodium:proton antiporter [Patescibacteria group bacterium]
MEHNTDIFTNSILAVAILLFLSSVISVYLKNIKMPYTVVLVVVGILLSILAKNVEAFSFLNILELTPELIFYIFLPVLIFESSYNIKFSEFKENIVTISVLSVVALLISTLIVGVLFYFGLKVIGIEIPFIVTLLFGALISATDPVATLALFKEMRIPKRLYLVFEGESLFNDGTAVVVFQIILASLFLGSFSAMSVISGTWDFVYVVFVACIFGAFMGYLFSFLIGKVRSLFAVEMTLTLVLAHTTFIIAERFFGASGIIATVFAGLIVGGYGRSKISPPVREIMEKFWCYGAFVVNSLIFLLIGLSIDKVNFLEVVVASIIGIVVVLIARTASVFVSFPFIHKFSNEDRTPFSWQLVLSWGGLRGALALAIALLLPEDFIYKDFILTITLSIILFTLIIQATTIKKLIQKLGIDKLSDEESFELEEGFIFIDEIVRRKLVEMEKSGGISNDIYKKLARKYTILKDEAKGRITDIIKSHGHEFSYDEMIKILARQALGIEKKSLYTLFSNFEISEIIYSRLNNKLDRQIKRIELGKPQFQSVEEKFFERYIDNFKKLFFKFLREKKIFLRWIKKCEVSSYVVRYKQVRARSVLSREVIVQLNHIKDTNVYSDNNAINDLISRYKEFEDNAISEMKRSRDGNSELVDLIDYSIANNTSIRFEKNLLLEMNQNGIISEKVYTEVDDYFSDLIHRKNRVVDKYLSHREF